jgi:hypothetical protein
MFFAAVKQASSLSATRLFFGDSARLAGLPHRAKLRDLNAALCGTACNIYSDFF